MSDSDYGELIKELQVEYLASFPEKFSKIDQLFKDSDWHQLELEFHKLKGTGKTYGLPEVSTVCREMERLCKSGSQWIPPHISICLDLLKDIQNAYQTKTSLKFEIESDPRYIQLMKAGS